MVDMETMSGRMRADVRHVFHETGRLWPVADAHGAVVLFSSRDAADLYAAEHDAAVGSLDWQRCVGQVLRGRVPVR